MGVLTLKTGNFSEADYRIRQSKPIRQWCESCDRIDELNAARDSEVPA
jgi:hypothetical protein